MADFLGYAASCAVLATFLMRTMVPLRLVAILSNILFLAFAYLQNIHPVLFLHMALLPVNVWRLVSLRQTREAQLIPTPFPRKRLSNTHTAG
jgi:CRP/FNR family transcriptional regulator, cyclic AMP receptor protein